MFGNKIKKTLKIISHRKPVWFFHNNKILCGTIEKCVSKYSSKELKYEILVSPKRYPELTNYYIKDIKESNNSYFEVDYWNRKINHSYLFKSIKSNNFLLKKEMEIINI